MPPSSDILWRPSASRIETAALTSFARVASVRAGRPLADYDALYRWSIEDTAAFWQAVADFCGLIWQRPASRAYTPPPAGGMLGARWFEGATLNFAENLLTPVTRTPDAEVVVSHAEGRGRVALRGRELLSAVARCAAALEAHGVGPGDRVVGILANVPEALVAMLATAARGAVWSSCSPDFGAAATCDRFGQVAPKVVFFTTGYLYGGKRFSTKAAVEEALARLPARLAVAVDHLEGAPVTPLVQAVETIAWDRFLGTGSPRLEFVPRRFDDPQYILFSSGTTGVPKCITHGVGGTLLQHAKELVLHCDLKAGDRLLYYTTCGWMMWNWMASALACGATLALYEGSPASPDTGALWRVAADEGVTHLGVSPKYLAACAAEGLSPRELLAGARLRTLLSTGAPLLPEQFAWVYREVAADLHLASISGGTDIVSCFMLGVPTLPVRAGEIQRAGLGMAIEAWDETGHPVRGRKGELVCVQPFPSMPVSFWNDPDGAKYRNAYFTHYDREVWRHGDFVEITAEGGIVVYGRSDATLNPGGVRIGTAELYRQVETLPEVADSLAIGREADGDTEIWLFVKLRDARPLDAALETRIKATIREALTPRHVPRRIVAVQDIPYTRSGKKVELAVTEAVHGRPVTNMAALANPEAMVEYVAMGRR
jgi:acetoacetyl-CoA synthetase